VSHLDRPLILGSRGSALALAQVELTRAALAKVFPALEVKVEIFITRGDKKLDLSLLKSGEAGGKGLFTKELEDALLAGSIDLAVHSLKDLPGHMPPGLELAAVLERANTADILLSKHPGGLEGLPHGSTIGTSSVRRARQLQWKRPDLAICEWRGNVQTRLRKLGASVKPEAIVLAQAGLERLGFALESGVLEFEGMSFHVSSLARYLLPAIGQGAIALQSLTDAPEIRALARGIDHEPTHIAVRAERELQRLLGGDCTLPVGVHTALLEGKLAMSAVLFRAEGTPPRVAAATGTTAEPEFVAQEVMRRLEEFEQDRRAVGPSDNQHGHAG
jgi:hydroxymethylbilane synthase